MWRHLRINREGQSVATTALAGCTPFWSAWESSASGVGGKVRRLLASIGVQTGNEQALPCRIPAPSLTIPLHRMNEPSIVFLCFCVFVF